MNRKRTAARGFTLIELMVVIVIIGMLAAILIPTINGALRSAKRARALSQIKDLDGALKRYFTEYGKMPVPAGDNGGPDKLYTDNTQAAVIEILINNSLDAERNPRKIVFLDLDPASFGVETVVEMQDALRSGTAYKDPWGTDYGLLMDLNFDEKIDDLGGLGEIRAKAAVYSAGEDLDVANPKYKTW